MTLRRVRVTAQNPLMLSLGLIMDDLRLLTIGVYGFTENGFFSALTDASVDVFCDIRRRRGLRGSQYAFANSRRLQARLQSLGIRYIHLKEMAPTEEVRNLQRHADKDTAVGKRDRLELSGAFVQGYAAQCLAELDSRTFVNQLGTDTGGVALFCVERYPEACHRSLLAKRLADDLGLRLEHITP